MFSEWIQINILYVEQLLLRCWQKLLACANTFSTCTSVTHMHSRGEWRSRTADCAPVLLPAARFISRISGQCVQTWRHPPHRKYVTHKCITYRRQFGDSSGNGTGNGNRDVAVAVASFSYGRKFPDVNNKQCLQTGWWYSNKLLTFTVQKNDNE